MYQSISIFVIISQSFNCNLVVAIILNPLKIGSFWSILTDFAEYCY